VIPSRSDRNINTTQFESGKKLLVKRSRTIDEIKWFDSAANTVTYLDGYMARAWRRDKESDEKDEDLLDCEEQINRLKEWIVSASVSS
jgi:hypothetical protein